MQNVVLAEKLRTELLNYLHTRFSAEELKALANSNLYNKALFATQKNENGFTANTLTYTMTMLYKASGLYGCSSHSGRRTFITKLSSKSVPLKVLMEMVGHKNLQTTQRYIDVTADMKRAAIGLV